MDQAILSALSEAAAPLDKVELVPLVSVKISRTVSAKEVNKALYALAGRGAVVLGAEKHGEKPTWVACEQAAPSEPSAPSAASAAAPASSDDEENRPLQPKAKRAKPKHEPEAAAGVERKDATKPSPAAQSRTVKEEPVDVAIAEEAAATGNAAAAVKAESSEDEEEVPLSSRVKPAAKKSSSGGRPKGRRRGAAAADDDDDDDDDDEEDDLGLAVSTAQAVLSAGAVGDHEGVLSACGVAVTRDSPFATLRKAYRALAKLIHPDKLGGRFAGATKAFQQLCQAFDTLTAPELTAPKGKRKAQPALARDNHNCFRTKVRCPRCRDPWGLPDSGLQPYEYTFMMQGYKTYTCCGCLASFGCMTASHECPKCREEIEYHPDDYHKQVTCPECAGTFGFRLYPVGPRVEAALLDQVLEAQRKRHLQRDAQSARASRRAAPPLSEALQRQQAEKLFVQLLRDDCPRCGQGCKADEVERRLHLRSCTDAKVHSAHAEDEANEGEVRARRAALTEAQDEVGNLAAWRLLGARADAAWMLTDTQLGAQCSEHGLDGSGARNEKLARLAAALPPPDEGGSDAPVGASAPANLHALSLAQLGNVCAAHGLTVPHHSGKEELIGLLEARPATLCDGGCNPM